MKPKVEKNVIKGLMMSGYFAAAAQAYYGCAEVLSLEDIPLPSVSGDKLREIANIAFLYTNHKS